VLWGGFFGVGVGVGAGKVELGMHACLTLEMAGVEFMLVWWCSGVRVIRHLSMTSVVLDKCYT
jgi:hypothetical protein